MKHLITCSLIAFLLGCSPSPAADLSPSPPSVALASLERRGEPGATGASAEAPGSATMAPTAAIVENAPTPAGDPIAFPDPSGLDALDSYSLVLRLSFKGMRDGQAVDSTDIYTHTVSRAPAAQFTTVQTTDPDGKPLRLLYGSIGQVRYTQGGADQPCRVRWGEAAAAGGALNPAQMLKPALRGKEAGRETVNGIPTRHYTLTASSFDPVLQANASGDLWIAETGDYVVRYLLRVQGDEAYYGAGVQGEQTTALELTDVGAKKPVVPPAGCPPPFIDFPVMTDATQVVRTPWGVSYRTGAGLDKTAAFYKEQMKALGWVLEPGGSGSSSRRFLEFSLAKEQKGAYISLTVDGVEVRVEGRVESN